MAGSPAFAGEGEKPIFAEINMIPFIDVALVLLVIFMVLSPMLVKAGLDLNLPGAASAQPLEDQTVDISLSLSGEVFFDNQKLAGDQMGPAVQAKLKEQPGALFVLRADAKARYQEVIELADKVREAGGSRLAFATNADAMAVEEKKDDGEMP